MNTDECESSSSEDEETDFEGTSCDEPEVVLEPIEEEIITEDGFYDTTYEYYIV